MFFGCFTFSFPKVFMNHFLLVLSFMILVNELMTSHPQSPPLPQPLFRSSFRSMFLMHAIDISSSCGFYALSESEAPCPTWSVTAAIVIPEQRVTAFDQRARHQFLSRQLARDEHNTKIQARRYTSNTLINTLSLTLVPLS